MNSKSFCSLCTSFTFLISSLKVSVVSFYSYICTSSVIKNGIVGDHIQ